MIVVQLIGGLGNQLFQYAFAKNLALKHKVPLKLDITPFQSYKLHDYSLGAFNIQEDFSNPSEVKKIKGSRLQRFFQKRLIHEKGFDFDARYLQSAADAYVVGYWQSEKYFAEIAPELRKELTLKKSLSSDDEKILQEIKRTTAVAVHVRRADYVSNANTYQVHGACSVEYYQRALEMLSQQIKGMHLFVFSDDPQWAQSNLKWDFPTTFLSHNKADRNYADLFLMSQCQHFVIANSTFSWWGAWLSNHPGKVVIAPKDWFQDPTRNHQDIVPERWLRT